mgnify:CR=1 FL=1
MIFAHYIKDSAVESQVAGRGHRLGRTSPLNIWYLLYGYGYASEAGAKFFQDRNPTSGGSLTKLHAEKFKFASAAPADYASSLFNTISAYAKNWGKLFAVKLPDKMDEYGFRYDPSLPTPQDFTQDNLEGRRRKQYEVLSNAFVEEGFFDKVKRAFKGE